VCVCVVCVWCVCGVCVCGVSVCVCVCLCVCVWCVCVFVCLWCVVCVCVWCVVCVCVCVCVLYCTVLHLHTVRLATVSYTKLHILFRGSILQCTTNRTQFIDSNVFAAAVNSTVTFRTCWSASYCVTAVMCWPHRTTWAPHKQSVTVFRTFHFYLVKLQQSWRITSADGSALRDWRR
jgi:hypothetical protein